MRKVYSFDEIILFKNLQKRLKNIVKIRIFYLLL